MSDAVVFAVVAGVVVVETHTVRGLKEGMNEGPSVRVTANMAVRVMLVTAQRLEMCTRVWLPMLHGSKVETVDVGLRAVLPRSCCPTSAVILEGR